MEKWKVKDEDLKYGLNQNYKMRASADDTMRYLIVDVSNIKTQYLNLGKRLSMFKRENYHLDFGFDTFEECIEKNLGMSKSTINRCINVYRRFGCGNKIDKYKDYNYSQLVEMLSMEDKELKEVKPDMSVRKIRDIKKNSSTKSVMAKDNKIRAKTGVKNTVDGESDRVTKGGFMMLLRDYADKLCKRYDNIVSVGSMIRGDGVKEIYIHVKTLPGMNDFEEGLYKLVMQKMD